MLSAVLPSMSAVLSAETVGDPESTRRVYATVIVFVALGVAMSILAIWLFRRTRPEPQLLAPLEIMDSRRWRRSEPGERRRELDAKRPPGARPLRRAVGRPRVDTEFDTAQPVRSFDDLVADDDQTSGLPGEGASEQNRPAEATDPTPLRPSRIDVSLVDAMRASGLDPGASENADQADVSLVELIREATEQTSESELLDEVGLLADAEGESEAAPESDADVGVESEFDSDADADADADREPVMPDEGLSRRPRDRSS